MVRMVSHTPVMLRSILQHLILSSMWIIAVTSNGESKNHVKIYLSPSEYEKFSLHDSEPDLPSKTASYYQHCTQNPSRFTGDNQITTPPNSTCKVTEIFLNNHEIEILRKDNLTEYISSLEVIHLDNVNRFHGFEPGVFRNGVKLHTIHVSGAPKLRKIDDKVFEETLDKLQFITIMRSGLFTLPYLGDLRSTLSSVNFEHNAIQGIEANRLTNVGIDLLDLSYNQISFVHSEAFQGSRIETLTLKGNRALINISEDAFVGLNNLKHLDLSETSITSLPTNGLENIESLTIADTETLKIFPSVTIFKSLVKTKLTYRYHCCAFLYPELHNQDAYEKYARKTNESRKNCTQVSSSHEKPDSSSHRSRRFDPYNIDESKPPYPTPTSISFISNCLEYGKSFRNVTCEPVPDAFNPCEDIMGNWVLRVSVWLVAILAIVGNFAVLIVLIARIRMSVPKFLMCNLSFADFCMGIYLILIADRDARSIGAYFNYAIDWQNGLGCQIAGFLNVFSTELSIFTLVVITIERWYTINYAILNRRLRSKTCMKIMAAGWAYAFIMALLPLFGVSGYSTTSICLPLQNKDAIDLSYLIILLAFSVIAFIVIVACYSLMYSSIRFGGRITMTSKDHSDKIIARRMALLVFADFACWAPVAFFSLATLVSSEPLISVTALKILVVFFYPFNSCVNPYLYALLTHQYRRDFFALLTKCGMCESRAAQYNCAPCGLPLAHRRDDPNTRENSATYRTQKSFSDYLTMQNGNHIIPRKGEK
ncbi:lutropin-choriogonadotropic hormone receptor [Diprion similis]|uniref:lutropin-choriogonadotropic hormone receptor n=1 Tax=Diprion similis TaxID=362088 RepID=UPI001EF914B7|nr:lutropin-choriogonadotropic hormone receptor [Diprion similis]